jgi:hypothetical protein
MSRTWNLELGIWDALTRLVAQIEMFWMNDKLLKMISVIEQNENVEPGAQMADHRLFSV